MLYIEIMKLKPKTKAFADKLLSDPKLSQTKAYMDTHSTTNPRSAAATAAQLLAKPSVQIYMAEHVDKAKQKIVELIDSDKEQIALQASESVLDRELGKATQRVEQTSSGVTLVIDLTNSLQQG